MRIIIVGIHNKKDKKPLCHSTRTGKVITKIINKLPKGIQVLRTNLFDIDDMPIGDELYSLQDEWYWTYLPVNDDIIVLLGASNHKLFKFKDLHIVKIAHPASLFYGGKKESEYIDKAVEKILNEFED